ncbi:MAG: SMC-Scp complex subunit ScpB [Pseudomonadota bacterium]
MTQHKTQHIIEAALLTAGKPLTVPQLQSLLSDDEAPLDKQFVLAALDGLADDLAGRGVELRQVASGYRLQVKQEFEPWVARLFEERPPRYSRALLETLALIAYRQPITRAEIEDVRGVSVSSSIVKTLLEREWIKVVGQRDVPGRPSMYGTTKVFLDYFNIKAVSELPPLEALMDLEAIDQQLDMLDGASDEQSDEGAAQDPEIASGDGLEETEAAAPLQGEFDDALDASVADLDQAGEGDDAAQTLAAEHDAVTDNESVENPANALDATASVDARPEEDVTDLTSIPPDLDATEADIDGLVHMLDQLDETSVQAVDVSDAPTQVDETDSTLETDPRLASPSSLARAGDTASAVEAARQSIVENADRVLADIAERDNTVHDPSDLVDSREAQTGAQESQALPNASHDDGNASLADSPGTNADVNSEAIHDADIAALFDADNRNHEAARGETITPADSLRRSPTDSSD